MPKPSYGWLPLSLHHKIDKRNIAEYARFTLGVNLDKFILQFTYEMLASTKSYMSSYVSCLNKKGCNLLTIKKKKNLAVLKISTHLSSSYSVSKNLKKHVLLLNFTQWLKSCDNLCRELCNSTHLSSSYSVSKNLKKHVLLLNFTQWLKSCDNLCRELCNSTHLSSSYSVSKNLKKHVLHLNFTQWLKSCDNFGRELCNSTHLSSSYSVTKNLKKHVLLLNFTQWLKSCDNFCRELYNCKL